MSTYYDLYETPDVQNTGEKQPLHARIVPSGTYSKKDFIERVSRHQPFPHNIIEGVLGAVVDELAEALADGYIVELGELGHFSISLKCTHKVMTKKEIRADKKAHDLGYSCEFYLDAKEKKYIDECGAANFFGIKDNTYITPKSSSILPSITNKSLMQLAEDMGIKVERRPIPEEELETFEEAGACGTAAVISPIQRIDDLENGKSYVISKDGKPGPVCTKLYNKLRGIQYGDEPDTHGWVTIVE